METKRICFLTQQYGHLWSGVGTYSTILVDGLSKKHDVTVVCPSNCKSENKDINLIHINKNLDLRHANWVIASYKFSKAIRDKDYDLIHFGDARDSFFYKKKKTPVLGTAHDYMVSEAKSLMGYKKIYKDYVKRYFYYNITKIFEGKALRKLDFVICNSNYVASAINTNYKVPHMRLGVVPLTIALEEFQKEYKEVCTGKPTILFIGNNFQEKGLPTLIKAGKFIVKDYPNATFLVIGKDPYKTEMQKLSSKLGIAGNVKFLGWVKHSEIINYYKSSDLYVMPSHVEGFGLVFLEAMACKIPVIGSNIGGIKELIQDCENGMLVDPFDYKGLSSSTIRILKDKSLRDKLIKNGLKTVSKYTKEAMIDKTMGVYNKLLRM